MADVDGFTPIEEKHGDDCTCPAAGRIVIELVAASRACPGDRNPHRAARTAAAIDGARPDLVILDEAAGRPHAFETTKPTDQYGRTTEESRP